MHALRFVLALIGLGLVFGSPLRAQVVEDTAAVIGFDEIEEEPPPPSSAPGWVDRINLSGRFDLNLELENPTKDDEALRVARFRNYHRFVFLKVTATDRLTLDAEVLDLSYYEIKYELPAGFEVYFGKIWVPFGATPFHHYYGGRQGDPFTGQLVPNVWAEFGGGLHRSLYNGAWLNVGADVYGMRGFDAALGNVLDLASGGSDDAFAGGARTRIGLGSKLAVWGSVLYNTFGADNQGELLLWGGDILVDYGLIGLPLLKDLRLRAAFARAEVKDPILVDPRDNADGWYFRYGDYAELTHRGIAGVSPRVRYGTIIDFDDRLSSADTHTWEVALLARLNQNLLLMGQYQFNFEEVNEVDDDLARLHLVFEF